jgi:hypothetical protein
MLSHIEALRDAINHMIATGKQYDDRCLSDPSNQKNADQIDVWTKGAVQDFERSVHDIIQSYNARLPWPLDDGDTP